MADTVIDKAWSDLQAGDTIRFATPRFIKHGRVLTHKAGSDSLLVQFFGEHQPRGIPNARWYFVQAKLKGPDCEEHLVCVEYSPLQLEPEPEILQTDNAHDQWISVQAACEMIQMEAKQLRRFIRRGVIPAHKKDDRWLIHREKLRDVATKHGWL